MALQPEQSGGKIRPWYGPMDGGIKGSENTPAKPFVLNLPGIKKDLSPATEKDNDPTIIWGDWSGKTNYEEPATSSEPSTLDEDELRAATGCGKTLLGT